MEIWIKEKKKFEENNNAEELKILRRKQSNTNFLNRMKDLACLSIGKGKNKVNIHPLNRCSSQIFPNYVHDNEQNLKVKSSIKPLQIKK